MVSSNFLSFAVFAVILVTGHAASSSYSCVFINGERKCAYKDDPNGNVAAAAAGIGGGMGVAGAGAGTQDNFNTDYQKLGYGENNEDADAGPGGIQPFVGVGVGPYGPVSAASAGTGGFPNNFPQFNGNPFTFVHDFMSRFGGNRPVY